MNDAGSDRNVKPSACHFVTGSFDLQVVGSARISTIPVMFETVERANFAPVAVNNLISGNCKKCGSRNESMFVVECQPRLQSSPLPHQIDLPR